jgi:glutathione S-transferase
MKLYYSPGACSLSPHIVLCEAGLTFDLVRVVLKTKTIENGQDFCKINPFGYVPALELDNGEVLLEGPAIIQYLADQVPEKRLAPENGTFERYQLQQQLNFISTELHKGLGALFNPALTEDTQEIFKNTFTRRLEVLVPKLANNTYLLGNQFSVADAYLFTVLSWCPMIGFDLSKWPELIAYQQRIAIRPAVQQALKEEGLID